MFTSGRIMGVVSESFRFPLVAELPELVEIDTGPKPKEMRDRLRCRLAPSRGGLAQASADRFVEIRKFGAAARSSLGDGCWRQ
jgi:hypothetical protein